MPEIIKSKKFQAAIVGIIAVIVVELIPGLEAVDVKTVLAPIVAYILGQGVADFGKGAEQVKNGHSSG